MMWGYNGQDWWWMVPVMLLFWGAVIAVVFVVATRARTTMSPGADKAFETLRARLASGAITQDEYEKTKRTLQG